jgi:hypothetical protein
MVSRQARSRRAIEPIREYSAPAASVRAVANLVVQRRTVGIDVASAVSERMATTHHNAIAIRT